MLKMALPQSCCMPNADTCVWTGSDLFFFPALGFDRTIAGNTQLNNSWTNTGLRKRAAMNTGPINQRSSLLYGCTLAIDIKAKGNCFRGSERRKQYRNLNLCRAACLGRESFRPLSTLQSPWALSVSHMTFPSCSVYFIGRHTQECVRGKVC